MRLIIAGSRTIDPCVCVSTFDALLRDGAPPCIGRPSEIVTGGCRGPDLAGEEWARANGIPVRRFGMRVTVIR